MQKSLIMNYKANTFLYYMLDEVRNLVNITNSEILENVIMCEMKQNKCMNIMINW